LLYLVAEDWYFCSHRLPLAIAARQQGYEVMLATRVQRHGEIIRDAGIELFPIELARHSHNPVRELSALREIVAVYRKAKPDIAHHVALKPVLYGSIAAALARTPAVVNAIAGLGYVFTSREVRARLLRPAVGAAYHLLLDRPNSRLILQNPDDMQAFVKRGLIHPNRAALIRGSGVDMQEFTAEPELPGVPLVVLPARLLRDKGVVEFVQAARELQQASIKARFALVGTPDPHNPTAISEHQVRSWEQAGIVEWWGWRDDMREVYRQSHIVCLPSYREGLPKALIEAAACGKPIVTCDVPGCREIVTDGDNGLLVPARETTPLAYALRRLIEDPQLRQRMGERSRRRAVETFSIQRVIEDTLAVYAGCLQS
jgi:glycosyltransferase involved in cell wall biosynthesis